MATADPVATIAESLKETEEIPRKQITEIVEVLGAEVALELLAETRRVQDAGGLEVRDGTRRRTDGGVYFSLAKARLPKADRNRIFRIRPPRPEGEGSPPQGPAPGEAAERPRRPTARDAEPARAPSAPSAGAGRRRVVEVEVLRHHAKPLQPQPIGEPPRPVVAPPPERELRAVPEERPVRRIVTVVPAREEAPPTPEAAQDRIRGLLKGFDKGGQRRLLEELLHELGGDTRTKVAAPASNAALDDKLREQVLASVTEALGLSSGDLARVLYGDENQNTRSKARVALERWRRR